MKYRKFYFTEEQHLPYDGNTAGREQGREKPFSHPDHGCRRIHGSSVESTAPCIANKTTQQKQFNKNTISEGLRDRVAGAFTGYTTSVIPFLKKVAIRHFYVAAGFQRNSIMGYVSRSLSGFMHHRGVSALFFKSATDDFYNNSFIRDFRENGLKAIAFFQRKILKIVENMKKSVEDYLRVILFHLSGDNREAGFCDMDPTQSLISHKAVKNGIPAVRTLAFGTALWGKNLFPTTPLPEVPLFSPRCS